MFHMKQSSQILRDCNVMAQLTLVIPTFTKGGPLNLVLHSANGYEF